jgi:hypothetical protein
MEWYRKSPARWRGEQAIARRYLTEVVVGFNKNREAHVKGIFTPVFQHGGEFGSYAIRIVYPLGFPEGMKTPAVYLDSHRDCWSKLGDSHIEDDWKLCLFVPMESESKIDFTAPESLEKLLLCLAVFLFKERIYQQSLINQAITGQRAVWPGKARSHGIDGIIEALMDKGDHSLDSYLTLRKR